jgi:hypothetical protein
VRNFQLAPDNLQFLTTDVLCGLINRCYAVNRRCQLAPIPNEVPARLGAAPTLERTQRRAHPVQVKERGQPDNLFTWRTLAQFTALEGCADTLVWISGGRLLPLAPGVDELGHRLERISARQLAPSLRRLCRPVTDLALGREPAAV